MIKLYEKYISIKDVKDAILLKAVETGEVEVIDFFIKKGYDINADGVFIKSLNNESTFRYFLSKGVDPNDYKNDWDLRRSMEKYINIQKALIDFDYEELIRDTVGFIPDLKDDPKYKNAVKRAEEIKKYNL